MNPAYKALFILRASGARVDAESFRRVAEYCYEPVDTGDAGTLYELLCDLAAGAGMTIWCRNGVFSAEPFDPLQARGLVFPVSKSIPDSAP